MNVATTKSMHDFRLHSGFDAAVSLGRDCQVAHQLDLNGLRGPAFPFDWFKTPVSGLYRLIKDEFAGFLLPKNLRFVSTKNIFGDDLFVEDTEFGVQIIHDFPLNENFMASYDIVHQRVYRRVSRFLDLLRGDDSIALVRFRMSREEAADLSQLLRNKYPSLRFLLVVVDSTDEIKADWKLPNTRNFYVDPVPPDVWQGNETGYRAIFEELAIKAASSNRGIGEEFLYIAELTVEEFPTCMRLGEVLEISATLTNTSGQDWNFDGLKNLRFSYHWLSEKGERLVQGRRTELPHVIKSGRKVPVVGVVEAPTIPGTYILELDLVVEYVAWFSSKGWPSLKGVVEVQ